MYSSHAAMISDGYNILDVCFTSHFVRRFVMSARGYNGTPGVCRYIRRAIYPYGFPSFDCMRMWTI